MPSGLSQSHQEIAGQFQRELLQLICLGSGGQHVQRPPPRGMGRPIGLQCPCNSFTRQEVRGASDSTNQRIENNALVSSSGITGGARRVVYLVTSCSPVRPPASSPPTPFSTPYGDGCLEKEPTAGGLDTHAPPLPLQATAPTPGSNILPPLPAPTTRAPHSSSLASGAGK